MILQKEYNFGINRVIAFGDNENDLDLLKTAGLGIAVANAKSTLKAVADEITLQNTEDGVVVALKNHVFCNNSGFLFGSTTTSVKYSEFYMAICKIKNMIYLYLSFEIFNKRWHIQL